MLFDDLFADGQPQACSPVALGGEKDGEELFEGFGGHAGSGIRDADIKGIVAVAVNADGDLALFLSTGLYGVAEEIQDATAQSDCIELELGQICVGLEFYFDLLFAGLLGHQVDYFIAEPIDIGGLQGGLAPASKAEHVEDKVAEKLHIGISDLPALFYASKVLLADGLVDEEGSSVDTTKDVFYAVSKAGDGFTYGCESLSLEELFVFAGIVQSQGYQGSDGLQENEFAFGEASAALFVEDLDYAEVFSKDT